MTNLKSDFKKECISNGFANLAPNYFARCVGDGIFQTIYTGFKQYISTDSSNYHVQRPKDYYISIGLYSMYTQWPEHVFVPGRNCGGYIPNNFVGTADEPFEGIEREYIKMLDSGFSVLDSLNSQEKLLEFRNKVMLSSRNSRIHSFDLVGPYLVCGNIEDALFEINHQYTHSVVGFFRENDCLLSLGETKKYLSELSALKERLNEAECLWVALISSKYDFVHSYLNETFERNCVLARKNNIPFSSDFHKVTLPL